MWMWWYSIDFQQFSCLNLEVDKSDFFSLLPDAFLQPWMMEELMRTPAESHLGMSFSLQGLTLKGCWPCSLPAAKPAARRVRPWLGKRRSGYTICRQMQQQPQTALLKMLCLCFTFCPVSTEIPSTLDNRLTTRDCAWNMPPPDDEPL